MQFYFIYKALAHPELNGYVQPYTLEERLMHIAEAERTLGTTIPWLCDTMQNELKHSLGNAPNSEFVIGPAGKVLRKRVWSDADQLRTDLEELVGPVANPTQASDIKLKTAPPPKVAARGVVKRIERPGGMRALRIEPVLEQEGQPFYVKLRAEADSPLLENGQGKLYLGFHMDPIYHVHWNNLAMPIRVELETPQGIKSNLNKFSGPQVEEPADIDPREFLVEVEAKDAKQPIQLTVHYFACHDEEGWCKPVKQQYSLYLTADPDAGWTMQHRGGFGGRRRGFRRRGRR